MKIYIYWIFWLLVLLIMEFPLVKRFIRYYKEIELSRLVAVIILMIISAGIVFAMANLGLLLIRFVVK